MTGAKRLFFGNPAHVVDVRPMPPGRRLAYGEPTAVPMKGPMLPSGAKVLAYGNSPIKPQPDTPYKKVGQHLELAENPRT
jgi:hypothetical protein